MFQRETRFAVDSTEQILAAADLHKTNGLAASAFGTCYALPLRAQASLPKMSEPKNGKGFEREKKQREKLAKRSSNSVPKNSTNHWPEPPGAASEPLKNRFGAFSSFGQAMAREP